MTDLDRLRRQVMYTQEAERAADEIVGLRRDLVDLALAAKSLVLLHNRAHSDNVCTILARPHVVNLVLEKMRS